jgi:hypothetical protein
VLLLWLLKRGREDRSSSSNERATYFLLSIVLSFSLVGYEDDVLRFVVAGKKGWRQRETSWRLRSVYLCFVNDNVRLC